MSSPLTPAAVVLAEFLKWGASLYNCWISVLETSVMLATEDDGAGTIARDWEVTVN